jgi:DNA-binding response OmpR family regulator
MGAAGAAHILVVDDDAALRAMLRASFEAEGRRGAVATDGAAAVAVVGTSQPGLIPLAAQKPGANGVDVARELGRRGGRAPIVLMSTSDALR